MSYLIRRLIVALLGIFLLVGLPTTAAAHSPRQSGRLRAWGRDGWGQLGISRAVHNHCNCLSRPVAVGGVSHVVQIAAADHFTVVLESNGTVYAWGANDVGQLGIGRKSASGCLCVRRPAKVKGLHGIVEISATGRHTLALSRNGTVWAWGDNHLARLGIGPVCIATFSSCHYGPHAGCVCRDHPVRVPRLPKIASVSAGSDFSLALSRTGQVFGWGDNYQAETGNGNITTEGCGCIFIPHADPITNVRAISAGAGFGLAVTTKGTVIAWGGGSQGQLGNGESPASTFCSCQETPVTVSRLTSISSVTAGSGYALAVGSNGDLWAWGDNHWGNLGTGRRSGNVVRPVRAVSGQRFRFVATSIATTVGITMGHELFAWGGGSNGDLANGRVLKHGCSCRLQPRQLLTNVATANIGQGQVFAFQKRRQ